MILEEDPVDPLQRALDRAGQRHCGLLELPHAALPLEVDHGATGEGSNDKSDEDDQEGDLQLEPNCAPPGRWRR